MIYQENLLSLNIEFAQSYADFSFNFLNGSQKDLVDLFGIL